MSLKPCEPQAMRRYLLRHIVQLVQFQSTTEMKDRIDVLDWDKLSMYDQDDLLQLTFVARETIKNKSIYLLILIACSLFNTD